MQTEQPKRIFCKANPSLNVAVNGDRLVLVRADSSDTSQHWIQDYSSVGKLTDDTGRPAFALVNRATGHALVVNGRYGLQLAPYRGDERVEVSMLWSLGVQRDGRFSEVRVLRNMSVTLNALGGYAGEGTAVGLFNSEPKYAHAVWKIVPIDSM